MFIMHIYKKLVCVKEINHSFSSPLFPLTDNQAALVFFTLLNISENLDQIQITLLDTFKVNYSLYISFQYSIVVLKRFP